MLMEGLGLSFWPHNKLSTDQSVQLIKAHLPQWTGCFRLLMGEGSQDFNFYNPADRQRLDGDIAICKAFDAPAIVPLNGYHELLYQKYGATYKDKAEIARKSNLAIVNECIRQNLRVHSFAICNELFAKNELIGWSTNALGNPEWSRNTIANTTAMKAAADKYMNLVWQYESLGLRSKIALPMGTDLNLGRRTWDTRLFDWVSSLSASEKYVFDAHLYPSTSLTGQPLKELFDKRIGRGASQYGVIVGECAPNLGMYGTETVNKFARTSEHFARLKEYATVLSGYPNVKAVCFHKGCGLKVNNNNYDLIQI